MATVFMHYEVLFPSTVPNVDGGSISFDWTGDSANEGSALAELVNSLTSVGGGQPTQFLHPSLDRTTNHGLVNGYDVTAHLNGSPHGGPTDFLPFTLTASSSPKAAPAQLAIVTDFHADYGTATEFAPGARPRSRLRGRHFWGPLNDGAITSDSSTPWNSSISTAFLTALQTNFYPGLLLTTHFGPGWSVWSRKNAAFTHVISGWVDHSVHVQRRRSDPSGIKHLWV